MIHIGILALVLAGDPLTSARTIPVHDEDMPQINLQLGFVSEVHLPLGEVIMTDEEHAPRCGNRTFFQVNASGNVLYLEPMDLPDGKEGGKTTNVALSTISGGHYTFVLKEVSKIREAHADLKVFVLRVNQSNIVVQPGAPKFVPISQLNETNQKLTEIQQELIRARGQQSQIRQQAITEAVANVDLQYTLSDKKGEDFHAKVFRDDVFTYVEVTSQELPTVWEIRDGKLSKIDAVFRDGKYSISHLVDEGELRVGKSSIKFKYSGRKL